eukprot:GHRQ01030533.1.p1 GENE.GHRQ01030533.1~~GHRQ01030533.1.p1  ORF type:complete len:130 (+),score=11.37 GHRQ01030533.1:214-603(+)
MLLRAQCDECYTCMLDTAAFPQTCINVTIQHDPLVLIGAVVGHVAEGDADQALLPLARAGVQVAVQLIACHRLGVDGLVHLAVAAQGCGRGGEQASSQRRTALKCISGVSTVGEEQPSKQPLVTYSGHC